MIYSGEFPIITLTQEGLQESLSFTSTSFDLLLVSQGSISVTSTATGETILYPESSITVLHSGLSYLISPGERNTVIRMSLRPEFLMRCGVQDSQIYCDSVLEPNRSYARIRNTLTSIAAQYLDQTVSHELSLYSLLYHLADLLISDFSVSITESFTETRHQARLFLIRDYLYKNYRQPVTLNSLAVSLYLTPQYLSAFFKKNFNQTFNQYLNGIRLRFAAHDLKYSTKTITEIAVSNGFPNISTFNRNFLKEYSMAPGEFRKRNKASTDRQDHAAGLSASSEVPQARKLTEQREIGADVTSSRPIPHNYARLLNVGHAQNMRNPLFRESMHTAARELGVEYAGIESLLSSAIIPRIAGSGEYYFQNITEILNFLYEEKLVPFFELGTSSFDYMNFTARSESARHYNADRFLKMLTAFLEFVTGRFNPAWTSKWLFEFWKIPDTPASEFLDLFEKARALIRQYIPDARIGGPGHLISQGSDDLLDLLNAFKAENILPDFITVRFFNLARNRRDEERMTSGGLSFDMHYRQAWIISTIREIFGKDIPLYISEFNSSLLSRTFINESCFQAAFICRNVLNLHEDSALIGYWMLDDSNFVPFDKNDDLINGISLISKTRIPMPSYFAYRLLNSLGDRLIDQGEGYCITSSDRDHYQILAYNYADFQDVSSLLQNAEHSIRDAYSYFETVPDESLTFTLESIVPGRYRVRRFLLDRRHGSYMDLRLGGFLSCNIPEAQYLYKTDDPRPAELQYLKNSCVPEERTTFIDAEDTISVSIVLDAHAVCLFDIRKEM